MKTKTFGLFLLWSVLTLVGCNLPSQPVGPTPTAFPATSTPTAPTAIPVVRVALEEVELPYTLHESTMRWTFVLDAVDIEYCAVGDSTAYSGMRYRSSVYPNQQTRQLCRPYSGAGSTEVVPGINLGWEEGTPYLYITSDSPYVWQEGPLEE